MKATYSKLRDGSWGVRVEGTVSEGASVTVTKKSGESKSETIRRVLWSGGGISLCAIGGSNGHSHTSSRSHSHSYEDRVCRDCGHDGDGCADMDCTCRTCGGMMR